MTKNDIKHLTYQINGAAIEVHKALGPGLLESVYHKCMKHELGIRGLSYSSELYVPVSYKELQVEAELRCDLFIENAIVVEIKAIENIAPIHEAQLLTYMKLLKAPKGILINFHCVNLFKHGQKTFVNDIFRDLPE